MSTPSADGGRWAVKVFSPELGEQDLVRLRAGIALEIALVRHGVIPMAAPVADGEGRWLVPVQVGDRDALARCHRWLDGMPGTSVRPNHAIAQDVGASVGRVQGLRLPAGDTGELPSFDEQRWRAALRRLRKHGCPWLRQMQALTPLVCELGADMEHLRSERRPMFLGHGDLDPKNAIIRPDGRVALTDWDYAGPILPAAELVTAAVSFAGGLKNADAVLVGRFLCAYHEHSGQQVVTDALAMVIPALLDAWWLLDSAERYDPDGGGTAPPVPLPTFADDVRFMRAWATRIAQFTCG